MASIWPTLGLSDVRGRPNGLAIIPQDPVLMRGTMREVLDPFGSSTDEEIMEALSLLFVWRILVWIWVCWMPLSMKVGQLLCRREAATMPRPEPCSSRPRVLVLDEATASVDGETDAFMQTHVTNTL